MKKTMSCTLAATLAITPLNGPANEVAALDNSHNPLTIGQPSVTGKLEVDINFAIPISNYSQNDMKIILTGQGQSEEVLLASNEGLTQSNKTYTIEKLNSSKAPVGDGESISFIRVIFEGVELGDYSFELSGSGYKSVTVSNLDITTHSKRVRIGTQENRVVTKYNENSEDEYEIYPALFLAGDIDNDDNIDMGDYQILLQNINSENLDTKYDLNKDGKVDISDLSFIKSSIGSEINLPPVDDRSYIENTDAIINPENIGMGVVGATVTGDLKDLLKSNTNPVQIVGEVEPSEENPLSIKMNLVGTNINIPEKEENPEENLPEVEEKPEPGDNNQGSEENTQNPDEVPGTDNTDKESEKGIQITAHSKVLRANLEEVPITMERVVIKAPNTDGSPEKGNIVYLDENNNTHIVPFGKDDIRLSRIGETEISIDLGSQVAVKEISIDVTGNRGNKNICEIAKIEFLNNVYKEIPKPVISIPTIKTLETSTNLHDERITLSWEAQPNVTGYEVKYYKVDANGNKVGAEKKLQTNKTNINILDKAIRPYDTFRVSIQSLNGEWSSGYAEDLAKISPDDGGLTDEKKAELIPYELDGTPDNVDVNFNLVDSYYGTGEYAGNPTMGSVSDIQVVPISAPMPPRNLKINEGYRSLTVSWENHIQARDFDIYYRKIGSEDKRWIKANDKALGLLDENDPRVTNPDKSKLSRSHSYIINGLDDLASYEIKTTATNHLGTSKMSEGYLGTTKSINPPKMTNYKVINRPKTNVKNGEIPVENIIGVENSKNSTVKVDTEFAVVDNDFSTDYIVNDWDAGATYQNYRGPIVEFDKEYAIDRISLTTSQQQGNFALPNTVRLRGFDSEGNVKEYKASIHTVKDSQGKQYSTIKLNEPMTVKKLQVNLSVYANQRVSISEMKFHEADNIELDLKNLYKDEFRIELKDEITQFDIDDLRKRVNTIDQVSLEYNPDRSYILNELDVAQKLLNESNLSDEIMTLDPTITSKHGGVSLGMANDWQSLGAVVRPEKDSEGNYKKLIIYMGTNNSKAKVQIGFLQTYGQPGKYIDQSYTLKPGRNEITIPTIISENVEKGGQVMVRVEGGSADTQVKVRLANAIEIPHLDVNNLINDTTKVEEVKVKIRAYIRELKKYVGNLPNMYPKEATGQDNADNIYTYDPTTAVLNNTDIEGDRFTLTVPATQILKSIESGLGGNEDAQVERIHNALLAWEQQMQVTYAKKGVYESEDKAPSKEEYEKNKAPLTRMNIKYQRMMMGAAGYASSHHVGIGYGSVAGYMSGVPFKFDENQNVTNPSEARLYGDLIAHEIGHVTDIGSRTYDETSNNLTVSLTSSMLNQNPSKPGNIYPTLYEKVTSNTLGLSTNRSVVLGMLWQVYLAYEDDDTYKMLFTDNDTNPNNDSYFAKLNRAYRNLTEEETKNANRDQLLIRVTSKVIGKDLSDFYLAHGIVPNADTIKYVGQLPKEEKSIQYINDEARRQRLAGSANMSSDTKLIASFGADNSGKQILNNSYVNQNKVPINLSVTKDNNKILGYEILRNGKPVGFIEKNKSTDMTTYNDTVDNINNRVFTYEAVAYDYNLNKTEKVTLGTVKVRHDGSVEKSNINITSNTVPLDSSDYDKHSENPNKTLKNIIDNNSSSIYEGIVHEDACLGHEEGSHSNNEDAYVILDANEVRSLAGIKYTAPTTKTKLFKKDKISKSAIQNFEVQISKDGNTWTKVKEGQLNVDSNNPTQTIYFDKEGVDGGNQLNVYNTRFVKLVAKGVSNISIAELDLIGPPGDNIEIGVASDNINYKNGLGILKEDFIYQIDDPSTEANEERKIPKGSVIITGEYRGNPAFNVPLVLNEKEENIADQYKGILMADVPDNGNLEEIAEGNWIYWVEPKYTNQFMQNKQIFAELYRTDTADAQSGGQRLVSDTFKISVPDELLQISLSGAGKASSKSAEKKIIELKSTKLDSIINNR